MDIVVTIPKSEYKNDDTETKHMEIDSDFEAFWNSYGCLGASIRATEYILSVVDVWKALCAVYR
ncbi:hypothetical protein ACH33_16890 [Aneurinibacillus sp. XH2]|nr:hypothetical protein ACH33_16890 [Aneurinibacillus sp. XH2]